jgi:phosphatidylinositol alpha-1,6-mannosyltransferase
MIVAIPGLDERGGGVQVSAASLMKRCAPQRTGVIVYGSDPDHLSRSARQVAIGSRKGRLVYDLLRQTWSDDACLFWHIGMLKALPFLRGFRGRVILFCHGIELWKEHSRFTRKLLNRVDFFLSNSDYTWDRFCSHVPELRAKAHETIPLGIGSPWNGPTPAPAVRPSAVILARLAKAEDYKGHRELISAWPLVLKDVPEAVLDIIGDGDLSPDLQALVSRLGLGDAVRFHGRVNEAKKEELLAASRCLVMPSRGEGFGLVYLEAMRLGRPCLVSDCDAGREVVKDPDGGLSVNPLDLQAVAARITQLLSSGTEWAARSAAARRRYEAFFTEQHFQERLAGAIPGLT